MSEKNIPRIPTVADRIDTSVRMKSSIANPSAPSRSRL